MDQRVRDTPPLDKQREVIQDKKKQILKISNLISVLILYLPVNSKATIPEREARNDIRSR